MGVHPWPGIDPATAYMTMTGGAGAGPMHVASAGFSTLGGHAETTVAVSAVNIAGMADVYQGSGSAAAVASAAAMGVEHSEYGLLSMLKSQLLTAAGELHTTTVPQMVTHVQANANRMEYVADNAINPWVLGALTGRLIDLDGEYFGFMWPNNASAGLRYGAGLDAVGAAMAGLSALPSLAGGSVAAPAMAAADVAANGGITMASAAMSSAEQAATAVISPATSVASQASGLLGQAPLSAPSTSTSTPGISPMASVSTHAPAAPSMAQAQTPAMGMFLPPSTAAVNAPAPAPPVQTLSPTAGVSGAAPPGVTSFIKPAEPFKAPPMPSGGQATGLSPGMLNASALRGPVTTAPAATAVLTEPLTTSRLATATATQPLAYVTPDPTRPIQTPPPAHPPLQDAGTAQTLNPPPQPQQSPPLHNPPQQPAPGNGPPPGPSTGSGGPEGSGGPGTQTPGSGLGGAPPAPPSAVPLDTRPPPIPPPPSPGEPPLRPASPPSWASPPVPKSVQAAQDQLKDLERLIQQHNSNPPDPSNWGAVADYNAEADSYNAWAAQLHGVLDSSNVQYTPATPAQSAQIPSWTQPAPQQPVHQGPGSQPQPPSPSLAEQAKQIGEEVKAVPRGSGQLQTLADKVTGLHLDQEHAAEVIDIAAKSAFDDTGGIASLPDGTKVVLPANILQRAAMIVHSDGSVTVFKGDVTQFLPYLGR
jgi:hypothetical protein